MLRTEFENSVLNDVFNWYATTDEYKMEFSQDEFTKYKEYQMKNPDILKKLTEKYWSNYFASSSQAW